MLGWLKRRREEAPACAIDPAKTVVLFVCTANLSRSPMAEALFRRLVGDDPRWHVLSAGTKSVSGFAPSPEALTVLQCHGCDPGDLETTRLEKAMLERADHIFVMGEDHRKAVLALHPEAAGKCHLLRVFEEEPRERGRELPDPHEKPLDAYLEVFAMLRRLLPKVLVFVRECQEVAQKDAKGAKGEG